jgi:hypothetical protein
MNYARYYKSPIPSSPVSPKCKHPWVYFNWRATSIAQFRSRQALCYAVMRPISLPLCRYARSGLGDILPTRLQLRLIGATGVLPSWMSVAHGKKVLKNHPWTS